MAEAVMLNLGAAIGRQHAHDIVYDAAQAASSRRSCLPAWARRRQTRDANTFALGHRRPDQSGVGSHRPLRRHGARGRRTAHGVSLMSAIAFDLPEDVTTVRDGALRFVDSEIVPRVQDNHALFEDQRRLYDESGRYSADVQRLIRETRTPVGEGRVLRHVRAGRTRRQRSRPPRLLCRLGGDQSPPRLTYYAHTVGSFRTGPSGRAAC